MKMKLLRVAGYSALCFGAAIAVIYFAAPKGPSCENNLGGKYYNLVYSLSSCPAAAPQKYEQDGVSFSYFSLKDAPNMERHDIFSVKYPPVELALPGYTQGYSYMAGNIFVNIYLPGKKGPARSEELLEFSRRYAERYAGATPEPAQDCVKGAPFSACFRSGPREGACFTSQSGRVYCFEDQDMTMQGGRYPFRDTFICSVIGSGCALGDYSSFGFKAWFVRPVREKRAECNFTEIRNSLSVKRPGR